MSKYFGNYPAEYNRAVHGPYYPWVNYNKNVDTPLKEVKLGELQAWLSRRSYRPNAMLAVVSRSMHKWAYNYNSCRYGSAMKGYNQVMFYFSLVSMFACYGLLRIERTHKYHW